MYWGSVLSVGLFLSVCVCALLSVRVRLRKRAFYVCFRDLDHDTRESSGRGAGLVFQCLFIQKLPYSQVTITSRVALTLYNQPTKSKTRFQTFAPPCVDRTRPRTLVLKKCPPRHRRVHRETPRGRALPLMP